MFVIKEIACEKVGIKSISIDLKSDVSEDEVLALVKKLNDEKPLMAF